MAARGILSRHGAGRSIAVAMSGGVDSSVAAHLLLQQQEFLGGNVVGLHMSNWNAADEDSSSPEAYCGEEHARDARAVCDALNIPLHRASFVSEYWTDVFEPYIHNIQNGLMPNPDVDCNRVVKFGAMKEYAQRVLKVDAIATGHYARLWHRGRYENNSMDESSYSKEEEVVMEQVVDRPEQEWIRRQPPLSESELWPMLLAGADTTKDQSYFLVGVSGAQFQNVYFPLGHLQKRTVNGSVRELARTANLPTAEKRDSMGICFVGKRNFSEFISEYLPVAPQPGHFVNIDTGEIVGSHKGSVLLTMGQGAKISGEPPIPLQQSGNSIMPAWCRTRHLQPLSPCTISWDADRKYWTIGFDRPQRAITPGQTAAIYVGRDGVICLGGGPICSHGPTYHERGMDLPPLECLHPAGHNDLSIPSPQQQQQQQRLV
eukprot:scaffold68069_cov55-Attheya_sp.AAC.1